MKYLNLLLNLLRIPFGKIRYLGLGLQQMAIQGVKDQWIIERADCVYRVQDFAHIPRKERAGVLANWVVGHSPFQASGYYVHWQDDLACIWIWDKAKVANLVQQQLPDSPDLDYVPEPVIYPEVGGDCLVSVRCLRGADYQVWKSGKLRASRYWPESPAQVELELFLRASGMSIEQQVESLQSTAQPLCWGQRDWWFLRQPEVFEKILPLAMALLLISTIGFQSARWLGFSLGVNIKTEEFQQLNAAIGTRLEERNLVLRLKAINGQMEALHQKTQLELMSEVLQRLPEQTESLERWYFDANRLSLTIRVNSATPLNPPQLVAALQSISGVSDLSVIPDGRREGQWKIDMELSL